MLKCFNDFFNLSLFFVFKKDIHTNQQNIVTKFPINDCLEQQILEKLSSGNSDYLAPLINILLFCNHPYDDYIDYIIFCNIL